MLEWSVLQLSSTRDDLCPWGTAKAELGGSGEGAVSSQVQPWLCAAVRSDLCSSGPVIHSFSHQLKIPVV